MADVSRVVGNITKQKISEMEPITGATVPTVPDDADVRLSIGELADELGLTTRTIRFYEQKGLISPARKGVARAYGRRDRARMRLILQGKNLGFSLEDIAEYLALYDSDPAQVVQTQLLHTKVATAIADLETKRTDIERALTDLKDILRQCDEHLKSGKI
jgi:DNA-binding transcriptional MerR regulator